MKVAILPQVVCDLCLKVDNVKRWHITAPDRRKVSPDLCHECQEVLTQFYEMLPSGKRGQVRSRRMLTASEVEAIKKTQAPKKRVVKKNTRKRA